MERVASANAPDQWRVSWVDIALAALLLGLLVAVAGDVLVWSIGALVGVPITLFAAVALFLLPGLALLRLWPQPLPQIERWALALGLSCVVPPLLFLVASLVGLRWTPLLCWVALCACALGAFWPRHGVRFTRPQLQIDRVHLLLMVLTLLAIAVRLYVVRDLPGGMFGDSYHHTMIAQLMVDHGGLFASWQPYAPLVTFTYHYGFHSLAAWLALLSGAPVTQTVLLVGQLQGALVVPLVFVLTRRLSGSDQAGLWAGVVAGFIGTMPAFYTNWGRYTQLAGQTILPAACVVWMMLLDSALSRASRANLLRLGVLAVLSTAGIVLTHYRVAVFAAGFVAAYAVYLAFTTLRRPSRLLPVTGVGMAAGLLALLLSTPWLMRIREGALLRIANNFVSQNIGTDYTNGLPGLTELLSVYIKWYLVALALFGIVAIIARRMWPALTLPLAAALVYLAANPYLVGLPGAGILTNFAVIIASYLVVAPLVGIAISTLVSFGVRTLGAPQLVRFLGAASMVVGLAWGMSWQRNLLDTGRYQILAPADIEAIEWIKRETPEEARFYVNGFPAYGSMFVGSDGGWWLPLLAQRQTNVPPTTYGSEAGEQPGYLVAIRDLNLRLRAHPVDAPESLAELRAGGFTYLYDGPTTTSPADQPELITPESVRDTAHYEIVYQHAGVTIWKVR